LIFSYSTYLISTFLIFNIALACSISGASVGHVFENMLENFVEFRRLEELFRAEEVLIPNQLDKRVHDSPRMRSLNDQSLDKNSDNLLLKVLIILTREDTEDQVDEVKSNWVWISDLVHDGIQ